MSWQNLVGPSTSMVPWLALAVDPLDANRMYASDGAGRLVVTLDGGSTFESLSNGIAAGDHIKTMALRPGKPGRILAGGNHLYLTTDGGSAWREVNSANVLRAVFAGSSSEVAYAISRTAGVLKSLDGGENWMPANGTLDPTTFAAFNDLAVDPSDERNVYVITANQLYASRDGGQSWSSILKDFAVGGHLVEAFNRLTISGRRIFLTAGPLLPSSVAALAVSGDELYAAVSASGVFHSTVRNVRKRSISR